MWATSLACMVVNILHRIADWSKDRLSAIYILLKQGLVERKQERNSLPQFFHLAAAVQFLHFRELLLFTMGEVLVAYRLYCPIIELAVPFDVISQSIYVLLVG